MKEKELNYQGWRPIRPHKPMDFSDNTPCRPTRFFDQMCYIGDHSVCCFLLETEEGLVLIDCMWQQPAYRQLIQDGIAQLGHSMEELKAIVITHGHQDHFGYADEFRAQYGCKIYLSEIDNEYAKHQDELPGMTPVNITWDADVFIEDRKPLVFGKTTITPILTPGHTPGCMSFIVDVTDAGEPHKMVLWGGTGVMPWTDPDVYMDAVDKLKAVCAQMKVDCYISNHPFVDLSYFKLDIINHMVDGVNNPFVTTQKDVLNYLDMFRGRAQAVKDAGPSGNAQ